MSPSSPSSSSSSERLFNRQRTVHEILGGGFVADVILWRERNLTLGILLQTLAVWVVFERSAYTLLSLVSRVLLLLVSILFFWAKSAAILNRPAPPLPDLYLSEEIVNKMTESIRNRMNAILLVSQDIALGKDPKLFLKVAACLLLISVIGGWTDLLTLSLASLVIALTIPAIYERYEESIDKYAILCYKELQHLYAKLDAECIDKTRKWVVEVRKQV